MTNKTHEHGVKFVGDRKKVLNINLVLVFAQFGKVSVVTHTRPKPVN